MREYQRPDTLGPVPAAKSTRQVHRPSPPAKSTSQAHLRIKEAPGRGKAPPAARRAPGGSYNDLNLQHYFQKCSGFACCTCGSAFTLASTSAGSSPSISISATALPPAASRPTWKVAMLMPASPSVDEKRPMKPGLSRLVM